MKRARAILLCGGGPLVWSAFALMARAAEPATWQWEFAGGVDGTVHTYALAVADTTETISEFMVQAALEGRSGRGASRRWYLRAGASTGTELNRERLDAEYRFVGEDGHTPLRLTGTVAARQFQPGTDYTYSSDNWEGRLDGRVQPLAFAAALLELRAWGGRHDYRDPSTLEVDWRQVGLGAYLRSRRLADGWWSAGFTAVRRAYPDTAAIDRDQLAVELDWDSGSLEDGGLRLHHKTERREIADETARPSAWSHWTDLSLAVPAAGGRVVGDLQSEVWQYDYESEAWFDSWRLDGLLGYRWGDILAADWLVGVAAERLDAGDNPDSYHQLGLRAGVESFGLNLAGSLTVEYGRRSYDNATIELSDSGGDTLPFALYSDFGYWKIWFAGSWRIVDAVSLEGLASYEPESHTEQSDDSALGFLTLRLVWRP